MYARELNGSHIGGHVTYVRSIGEEPRRTENITMIMHKKNGRVLVRHGRRNAQADLHPLTEIVSVG